MDTNYPATDMLQLTISVTTTPAFVFNKPNNDNIHIEEVIEDSNNDFNIQLEAKLNYALVARTINEFIHNRRFDIAEGFIKMQVYFSDFTLSGGENNRLNIEAGIAGVFDGRVYLSGVPYYNADRQEVQIQDLKYEIKTKNLMVKAAKWVFSKRIETELEKISSHHLTQYYLMASQQLNGLLNKEWKKGIHGTSTYNKIAVTNIMALQNYLSIQANCRGNLSIQISI